MRIVAIIQARIGSTRLPGKVLRPLIDQTVLAHVIARCVAVPSVTKVIVATSTEIGDQAIYDEAIAQGVECYRGSENNVLSRYYEAAKLAQADVIIRITSDCPLLDPSIVEQLIQHFKQTACDYARIGLDVFPRGLDAEIFTMDALQQAYNNGRSDFEREHVTTYFQNNREKFKFEVFRKGENYSKYRLTLDTIEDWVLIENIYQQLYRGDIFGWLEVRQLLQDQLNLALINAHVEQKHNNV
ncbi:cytidylyltransferase domain-containing protein [Paenibacillus yanchengensis]|uniref:Cytidylyltransferase domain-containing protein n=1 Tax=Paenibacillus yanchengensis TaxID=2035833 RepID=A0ABW4YMK5_9BACL